MNTSQAYALNCFSAMLAAANHYRATGESGKLVYRYGICDNIQEFSDESGDWRDNARVKDNLIRRIPSFSGAYHYPVPGVDGDSAENIFDNSSDKWLGKYGANRVKQLEELIYIIQNNWDDELVQDMTPAKRYGLKRGDVVRHTGSGDTLVFAYDDGTTSPGFSILGKSLDDYSWVLLSNVERVKPPKKLSVKASVKAAAKLEDSKRVLQAQIAALEAKMAMVNHNLAIIDSQLLQNYGVKRA